MASILSQIQSGFSQSQSTNLLQQLQTASFRGVKFLVDSSTTTAGRKLVTHEYPNTNRREVEDLGELQPTFTVNGIITGNNYIQDRDSLIAALTKGGSGQLIHPFYGILTVAAKPYSLSEVMTELGVAKFSMTFEKVDESIFPSASSDNTSLINLKSQSLSDSILSNISNLFTVTSKYPTNFTSAKGLLTVVAGAFGINANNVLRVTNQISAFSTSLLTFTRNILGNIRNPSNLAADFNQLFGNFSLIGANATDQFKLLSSLFKYGDHQTPVNPTTVQKAERETNRQTINSAMNISALNNAYNTIPQLSFNTEDDIKIIQTQLDDQYEYVIANNNVPDDTIQQVKDLRVLVTQFLDQKLVNTYKISNIQTSELPMTVLCYQYYGSIDNTQNLINLNNTIDSSFVSGNVKILTQ